jgi:hypothetical protein
VRGYLAHRRAANGLAGILSSRLHHPGSGLRADRNLHESFPKSTIVQTIVVTGVPPGVYTVVLTSFFNGQPTSQVFVGGVSVSTGGVTRIGTGTPLSFEIYSGDFVPSPGGGGVNTGANTGTNTGGTDTGTNTGGTDTGTNTGGTDTGTNTGGTDTGTNTGTTTTTTDGGYSTGTTDGGYSTGTTDGGYSTGTTDGGYSTGTTSGGY